MTAPTYCRLNGKYEPACSFCHDYDPAYKSANVKSISTARCKHLTRRAHRRYPKIPAGEIVEKPRLYFHTFTRPVRQFGESKGCTFPKPLCDMLDLGVRDTVQVAVRKLSSDDLAKAQEMH